MKTTIEWLDEAKAKHSLSDYAIAPKLGVSKGQVSRYRNGLDYLSESTAVRLAELLDVDPVLILASAAAERSKSEEVRSIWERAAQAFASTAVGVLAGMMLSTPSPSAAAMKTAPSAETPSVYYVNRRKRKKANNKWLSPLFSMHQMA